MSSELIDELKRLTLEVERLKAMLVLQDEEREFAPEVWGLNESAGLRKVELVQASIGVSSAALLVDDRRSLIKRVQRQAMLALVEQAFACKTAIWGGLIDSPMHGPTFKIAAYVGVVTDK